MAPKKITKLIRLTSAKTITRTSKYIVKKEKRKGEFLGIRPHVLFKFFFFFPQKYRSLCTPQYAVTRHIMGVDSQGPFLND